MSKNSFILYTDYLTHLELLSMEQRGELFTAIMNYASEKELPQLDGMVTMAFSFIKAQMDRDKERYNDTLEARREAGKKGGRPTKANGFSEKQEKAKKANGFSEKQTKAKKPDNDNVNDTDNVNENDNVSEKNTYSAGFCAAWEAYPRKKEKSNAYRCYKARLNDGFSEDELYEAVKRYAAQCRTQHTEERYIKLASTFWGPNTPFVDYLEEGETHGRAGKNAGSDENDIVSQLLKHGGDLEFDGF